MLLFGHVAKNNLSPPVQPQLLLPQPCSSRASSIATQDDGTRRGARQWRRGGAPGGAAAYVIGPRAPRKRRPLVTGNRRGCAADRKWSARRAYVTGLPRGSRSAAPWRLPALHPLVSRGEGKWDAGHPGPEKQRTGAAERWLNGNRIATAASCLRAAPGSRLLPDPGRVPAGAAIRR